MFVLKDENEAEAEDGPFKKRNICLHELILTHNSLLASSICNVKIDNNRFTKVLDTLVEPTEMGIRMNC